MADPSAHGEMAHPTGYSMFSACCRIAY